jgi:hypothetical protein
MTSITAQQAYKMLMVVVQFVRQADFIASSYYLQAIGQPQ